MHAEDQNLLVGLYEMLVRCRNFEMALIRHASQDAVSIGHPYLGQEAVASGVCYALRPDDRVVSTHRAHGHAVAKGCDLRRLALELYGRSSGLCRGRAGEMYVAQYDVGYMGGTQVVGGNLAMGAGLALASLCDRSARVTVAFVGDGGTNQGTFHEVLNLAAIWKLPLVVVVENNGYAEATPTEYATAGNIEGRAAAYGIPGRSVDGQDAVAVHACATELVERARKGDGPSLIEARTYRYEGHYYGDRHRRYRTQDEVDTWRARDPVAIHREVMRASGFSEEDLAAVDAAATAAAEEALTAARMGPEPTQADLLDDVFAPTEASMRWTSSIA